MLDELYVGAVASDAGDGRPAEAGDASFGTAYLVLLRRAITRIGCLGRDLMLPLDLTEAQAVALLAIRDRDSLTQMALAKQLESDANTVSGLVRRLERRQLVTRTRRSSDARSISLSLTAEGKRLAEEAQVQFDKLAVALGSTVPHRSAGVVAKWLRSILTLHDI